MPNEETVQPVDETTPAPEGEATPKTPDAPAEKKDGEKDAPPAAPPEPPKARAKDLAAAMREKQRAIREKQAARQARTDAEAAIAKERADLAREREGIERMRARFAELPNAPEKVLDILGIDKETFFRRLVNDGKPAPEEEMAVLKGELAAMRKEIADRDAAQVKQRETAETQARARAEAEALTGFGRAVHQHAADYPNAAKLYSPRRIAEEAGRVVEWARKNGHVYSDREIAEYIDKKALAEYNEIQALEKERDSSGANESHAAGSKAANGHTTRPGTTRTLTNKGAQERASPPREMTDDEKDEWALAELRRATKADRDARGET